MLFLCNLVLSVLCYRSWMSSCSTAARSFFVAKSIFRLSRPKRRILLHRFQGVKAPSASSTASSKRWRRMYLDRRWWSLNRHADQQSHTNHTTQLSLVCAKLKQHRLRLSFHSPALCRTFRSAAWVENWHGCKVMFKQMKRKCST